MTFIDRIKIHFGALWITLKVILKVIFNLISVPFILIYRIVNWIFIIFLIPFALLYAIFTYKKDE